MKVKMQILAVALRGADGLLLRLPQQLKWKIMGAVPTRRSGLILRRLLIVFAVAVSAAIFASPAAADKPTKIEFNGLTFPAVLTGVCSFPINVDSTISGTQIVFYDKTGPVPVTRIFVHQVEQDIFTANGKMLVGIPYTSNIQFLLDSSGNVTHVFLTGLVEKIPLPDGSLFVSACRVDVANHPGVQFILSPDKGNPGNVAGFCAALSP